MTLEVCCKNCYKIIRFQNSVKDRVELKDKVGTTYTLSCSFCGQKNKYHLNKITVIPNPFVSIIAVTITIIATILFILKYSHLFVYPINNIYYIRNIIGLFLIPLLVFYVFNQVQKDKCSAFNSYRI